MAAGEEVKIVLNKSVYEKLKAGAREAGFSSVSEYAAFVLEEFASNLKGGREEKKAGETVDGDKEKMRKRLKSLGYMG
jgi:hypothetical protein